MGNSDNRIIYIIAGIVLILGVIFIGYKNRPIKYEPTGSGGLVVDVEEIPDAETIPEIEEKEKDEGRIVETTTAVKMTIKDIRDNGSKIYVVVDVGIGENKKESSISVTYDTIIYDYKLERLVGPYSLVEGAEIIYYGKADYNAGNTEAVALIMGAGDENIKFSRIGDVYKDTSTETYLANIAGTGDMLRLDDYTIYKNVTSGRDLENITDIAPNSRIFYKTEGVEKEIEDGNIYNIKKLFVVSKERDEDEERSGD